MKFSIVVLLVWVLALSPRLQAQLSLQTDSVGPQRFLAAHGRKAIVMGYASSGLELWAYPLQLISGYELGFRSPGGSSEINGVAVLRRVTYDPEAIIRTYIGPDFIVRERLFVPLNEQAIFLSYAVECRHSIDVVIHFKPVLDLMWPASLGGQNTHWDPAASAYVLAEPTHKYRAFIGSAAVVTHDQTFNSAQPGTAAGELAFAVRAGGEADPSATVVVARVDQGSTAKARLRDLLQAQNKFENDARVHLSSLLAETLRIETPDPAVNQQLAWAQLALDQAWVCNDVLGCGLVAGYGPSRDARRPQYDWFFAGDGLVAVRALLLTGDYDRAREELAFIAKYQDPHTGMIWHEISQGVDSLDWATKYPYMFVHVDITFAYLIAVERYVAASGDDQFAQENWRGLEDAFHYCASLLDPDDGLPRIPLTKEGGNEQQRMTDDVNLSVSWVDAAAAFARLAGSSGRAQLAQQAMQLSERAKRSVAHRYWDQQRNAWIDGFEASGRPVTRQRDDGVNLVPYIDQLGSSFILDRVASSEFETDWGVRGVAATSLGYDANSYASGSVSALGTAGVASAFWAAHRPSTAFSIWASLLPWGTLDSMGHMHEVLTGDFYHEQIESVPEQTWSSAGFLSSAVQGLLGLEREAEANRLNFSPHLPATWNKVSVRNIKVANGAVAMTLVRVPGGLELQIQNSGDAVELAFAPQIPLGAHLRAATLNGKPVSVREEAHPQDSHAILNFTLPPGRSDCLIRYAGGVLVSVKDPAPLVGEASTGTKITSIRYDTKTLLLGADIRQDGSSSPVVLQTDERPLQAHGARLVTLAPGEYELVVDQAPKADTVYRHIEIMVNFAPDRRLH